VGERFRDLASLEGVPGSGACDGFACGSSGIVARREKSSLAFAPSGVLPDGFICGCDQLTIVRIRNDGYDLRNHRHTP